MLSMSIIVPNYNGAEKALTLLRALVPQLRPEHEVVLVDDGSTDNSIKLLESATAGLPNIHIVQQANRGRAAARNRGALEAKGNLLLFLDNDIIPNASLLQRIEYVHSLHPKSWITGTIVQDIIDCPHRDFLVFRTRLDYCSQVAPFSPIGLAEVTSFSTQQLGVPREVFFRVGGFDEDLRDCEDFDLSVRAIDLGDSILHDTKNIVRHADYANIDQFIRRQIEYKLARIYLKKKKPELGVRFPELFPDSRDMSTAKSSLRRLFLWNQTWKYFFQSGVAGLIPRRIRFALFDLAISSNFLLAEAENDV